MRASTGTLRGLNFCNWNITRDKSVNFRVEPASAHKLIDISSIKELNFESPVNCMGSDNIFWFWTRDVGRG